MEVWGKIPGSTLRSIVERLLFCAMFLLPWINRIHAATFIFIITGAVLLLSGHVFINYSQYKKQALFILFFVYYLLAAIALLMYPHDAYTHADMERKASFVVIPLLLYIITTRYDEAWRIGIKGLVYGNIFAVVCCLIAAGIKYSSSGDVGVFFYHQYASVTGLSAIYLSLYLLTTLGYMVLNRAEPEHPAFMKFAGIFLYINLLLLSSKILIVAGTVLLIIPVLRALKLMIQKIALIATAMYICIVIACTGNPIKERYSAISAQQSTAVLRADNFKNFEFDGLSLRLLLWRLGSEVTNEQKGWLTGNGGERYHEQLNNKIKVYKVYAGNAANADVGYQNYNMHDQYMESYVQYGAIGVVLIAGMLCALVYISACCDNYFLLYTTILFSIAFITESVLETQAGLLLFIIITSGEWIRSQKRTLAALK